MTSRVVTSKVSGSVSMAANGVSKEAAGGAKRKRSASRSPSPPATEASKPELPNPKAERPSKKIKLPDASNTIQKNAITPKSKTTDLPISASHPRPARQIFVWGSGEMGQFGLGTDTLGEIVRPRKHKWFEQAIQDGILGGEGAGVETAAVGGMHSLVCDEAGHIWTWGVNDNAALGRKTAEVPNPDDPSTNLENDELESQPMKVQFSEGDVFRAIKLCGGDSISVALGEDGKLRVWGSFRSAEGLLGFDGKPGSAKLQFTPMAIPALAKHEFVDVAAGSDHVVALTRTGLVYVWGNGQQAQLGRRVTERHKILGLEPEKLALRKITCVGAGMWHSFAVSQKGLVYAWGLNSMSQTGLGGDAGEEIVSPMVVNALSPKKLGKGRRVIAISGGEHHTLFLVSDGSVWGCGRNDSSQIGLAADHPAMIAAQKRQEDVDAEFQVELEKQAAEEARKEKRRAARRAALNQADKNTSPRKTLESNEVPPPPPPKPPQVDNYIPEPVRIMFPPPPTSGSTSDPSLPPFSQTAYDEAPEDPIVHISVGTRHNLAVSKSGLLYAWGTSVQAALGLGQVEVAPIPTRVKSKAMEGWRVEAAWAAGQHCLLTALPASSSADE